MRTPALLALALLCCPPAHARTVTLSHYHAPGRRTASGTMYSNSRAQFASRAYPLGTRLRVTLHGRSVVGTVVDRTAKRYAGRLDVNEAARRRLHFRGLARAHVVVLRSSHPP